MTAAPIRPLPQKTIGVLGGMSDTATADYYRLLNAGLNARHGGWDIGEIVVVSVNFGNIQHFVRNGLWDDAKAYMADKLDRLERAGVDVVLCASNTMHRVVAPLMAERSLRFIHIVDPTGAAIRAAGLTRVALLGTAATMASAEMAERYRSRFGVTVMTPPADDGAVVDRIIFDELVRRDLRPASKAEYLRIVNDLRRVRDIALGLGVPYDSARFDADVAETAVVSGRMWGHLGAAVAAQPGSLPATRMGEALVKLDDAVERRTTALRNHVPMTVYGLLAGTAAVAMAFAGHAAGSAEANRRASAAVMAVLLSAVIAVTLDLQRPDRGSVDIPLTPLFDVAGVLPPLP